jgi:hypothetical protein
MFEKGADKKSSLFFYLIPVFYGMGLYLFYIKYVPLVGPFQAVLAPILGIVLLLTWVDPRKGTLLFIVLFPLINNLPYFFKLYEPFPVAPTALVLCLFFIGGWLGSLARNPQRLSPNAPIFKPLAIFAVLVVVSALITFYRYANFAPFLSDYVYELITNAHGVWAGGAIMSVVQFSLNYLTAIAFIFVLSRMFAAGETMKPIIVCVQISAFVSLVFGLFQHFGHISLGNNPISIFLQNMINATFKDALSFGAYLGMIIPLLLGIFFGYRGILRMLSFLILLLAGIMLFFVGSKSGLLGLPISLLIFILLNIKVMGRALKPRKLSFRRLHWSSRIIAMVIVTIVLSGVIFHKTLAKEFMGSRSFLRVKDMFAHETLGEMSAGRIDILWKLAIPMIKDYPLTGVGMGSYIIEVSNYAKLQNVTLATPESAENYVLQVGTELGLAGVFLIAWVFWELIRQINRSLKNVPSSAKERFVLSGAIGGIVSYMMTIQVHTFIGSYEIKYFFWLLVGLVFCLGPRISSPTEGRPQGLHPHKAKKIIMVGLIVLYGIVHLWNSTHSLSLLSRTQRLGLVQDFGYYQQEKTADGREFRWTKSYGGTPVEIEKPEVEIPLLASHPDIRRNPVHVKVYLVKDLFRHKRLLGELTLRESAWTTFKCSLKEELGQKAILLIKVSRTWNPGKILKIPDPRDLGVAVGKIRFN